MICIRQIIISPMIIQLALRDHASSFVGATASKEASDSKFS